MKAKIYLYLSIALLLISLGGVIFLAQQNQDNRNRAAECKCYPEDENVCRGVYFNPSCNSSFICQGTKNCTPDQIPTSAQCPREQCDQGSQTCQGGPNNNTGYQCNCLCATNPETGHTNVTVWSCGTYNPTACPPASGITYPANGSIVCRKDYPSICPNTHSSNSNYDAMVGMYINDPASCSFFDACGRDLTAGQSCVGLTRLSNGESNNGAFVGCSGNLNCFCDLNFSGTVRCISDVGNDSCGAHAIPSPTSVPPTATKTPSNTPTATRTPTPTATRTPTPTITLTPTNTPTGTLTPSPTFTNTPTATRTPTPTNTLTPTNTPTGTLTPSPTFTNTPIATKTPTLVPTEVIAQGPSPTRIILPETGIEFPAQILSIVGIIVTLAGFLILL